MGAWAEAKKGGSACLKDELSVLRLRAGREPRAQRGGKRLLSQKALPALRLTHLERLCGRPFFLALNFCYFSFKRKVRKKRKN